MARGRFLSDSVAKDMKLNSLSVEAELVYLLAIPHLDRDGLIEGDAEVLYGTVCPKRRIFIDRINEFVDEWVDAGLVSRYDSDEGPVLWFRGFAKNQLGLRYDRETPSKFPPPPNATPVDESPSPADNLPSTSSDDVDSVRQIDGGVQQDDGDSRKMSAQWQEQLEVKDQDQELQGDEEDTHAPDPVDAAWAECYAEQVPKNLGVRINGLVAECGTGAVVYAIHASKDADARNFRYIAQVARNYLPAATNGATSSYHVELPGVYALVPSEQVAPVAQPPPPLPHDDPWAIALAELGPSLPGAAASFLTGSRMERGADLAGVPLYLIVVEPRAAGGVDWLNKQVSALIRRKLGSILRQRVEVEIVAAEQEPVSP